MLIHIVHLLFQIYTLMLFARILSSWIPEVQQYRFVQFIAFYTDPYLNLFRRFIPPLGIFDISPIIAFFCLMGIENIVLSILKLMLR